MRATSLPVMTAEVCHPLALAQPSFATRLDLPVPDEPPQQTVDESHVAALDDDGGMSSLAEARPSFVTRLDLPVSDEATPGPDEATQLLDTAFHLELSSPVDSVSVGIPTHIWMQFVTCLALVPWPLELVEALKTTVKGKGRPRRLHSK